MVDHVSELTVKKSCKCDEYGSFEQLLFCFGYLWFKENFTKNKTKQNIILGIYFDIHEQISFQRHMMKITSEIMYFDAGWMVLIFLQGHKRPPQLLSLSCRVLF